LPLKNTTCRYFDCAGSRKHFSCFDNQSRSLPALASSFFRVRCSRSVLIGFLLVALLVPPHDLLRSGLALR
jgi:hypothetical protein